MSQVICAIPKQSQPAHAGKWWGFFYSYSVRCFDIYSLSETITVSVNLTMAAVDASTLISHPPSLLHLTGVHFPSHRIKPFILAPPKVIPDVPNTSLLGSFKCFFADYCGEKSSFPQ